MICSEVVRLKLIILFKELHFGLSNKVHRNVQAYAAESDKMKKSKNSSKLFKNYSKSG